MTDAQICGALVLRRLTMEVRRTVASHIVELKKKHEHLSDAVARAQRSPAIDALQIAEMKKQKLKLKEEIARLAQH